MSDTSVNEFLVDRKHPILLVTDDRALALLISMEAAELALPLLEVDVLPRQLSSEQVLIADLDTLVGMQAVLSADKRVYIGICGRASDVPTMLRAGVLHLLERPLSTGELRALLGELRAGVSITPLPHVASERVQTEPILFYEDGTVLVRGVKITLTPKETVLLQYLLAHRGEVVTKEALAECLAGTKGESNKTEVYLCYLRRKLEKPTGRRLISTVRGVGYRLEWE